MSASKPTLEWCIISLDKGNYWWVNDISDTVRWDVDGLGIIDPKQIVHLIDLCDPLRDYGFNPDIINEAFFVFRIDKEMPNKRVRLIRSRELILESEGQFFALPNVLDEEKGPYADLLDQASKARVNLLNDLIDFKQKLTIDELEDEIREAHNSDLMEGLPVHFFNELAAILEYTPEGFELDEVGEADDVGAGKSDLDSFPDIDDIDEKIVEDDTMKWESDEKDEDKKNELNDYDDYDADEYDSEEKSEAEAASAKEKPKRGRPRKK